ncbi:MAG: UDP-N-acetylmuramate dehydrogenase [Acidobacteriota bacterium]|nr:UDP-N-acetylmuramate dehydrogenase [Acidobacteriota bacterium]
MAAEENRGLKILQNVPLAPLTTLKIGGAARFFVSAKSETEAVEAVRFARENSLEIFVLGGGSNVLISDSGFDGLVLQIALRGISTFREADKTIYVTAGAGEDWDDLVKYCVEKNLAGFECLSGIPGFVGGTPVQNVGAYGQEVSETIVAVRALDRENNRITELANAECGFAYRASIFNTTEKNRYIVLGVTYALKLDGAPKIVYRDLQKFFGDKNPDLAETRAAVLKIRAEKSMVINAADPNSRSAGSFFKNPIVTNKKFAEIAERAKSLGIEEVPKFPVDEETVKIPAAWLIEKSGFRKGFRKGRAGLSTRHTLALVNAEGATARDILDLKDEIQNKVEENFGVELIPEPVFVGFD